MTDHEVSIPEDLCGICDQCKLIFSIGDNIIKNKEYQNTMFNLQYCNEKCKDEAINTYPYLSNLTFETQNLLTPITKPDISSIQNFIIKYPWSINYNSNQMVTYIEELKNNDNLTPLERDFINNYSKYIEL